MGRRRRLAYGDGDWFAVPLRDGGGFGLGVVTHHDGRGGVVAYFFGGRYDTVPDLAVVETLEATDAIRVMRFGDLGLIQGEWPVIGRGSGDSIDWPLPDFGRRDLGGRAIRVTYSPDQLAGPLHEVPISDDECNRLPRDALSGAGAVELVLTALLIG